MTESPAPGFLTSPFALKEHLQPILSYLFTARPTAVNLGAATRRLEKVLNESIAAGKDVRETAKELIAEGNAIANEDVGRNRAMSKWGGDWLIKRVIGNGGDGNDLNVLTVCNTGSLATSVRICLLMRLNSPSSITEGIWYSSRVDYVFT